MTPEEFRRNGHRLIDWVADYLETVEDRDVVASVQPGDIRAQIPAQAPEHGEPFADLLADLDRIVMPGITHWQHPGWFAYFPASSSPPAILAELVSAGLGVQGMLWSTSPAATEIESAVMDWLVDLLGLPPAWRIDTGPGGGVLQLSASDATHTSLAVARHEAVTAGADPGAVVAYGSSQAHSSFEKGARVAGYGHIRPIAVDDTYAMRPEALRQAITDDIAAGLSPTWVCSTVGTTATTAVDPVSDVAAVATEAGLWHHVDAAYAGSAMICPEHRHHQAGLELVDSYVFNPHKWLLTNFDCSAFYVADRQRLTGALAIVPAYLRNAASESGAVIDYRDWHVPLGRRFRALKLWWVLRTYGAEGLRSHIRSHVEWTAELADELAADPRFELIAAHPFALVCFRHVEGNERTRELATQLNEGRQVYLTSSEIDDLAFIRVSIGSATTERRHVEALWDLIDRVAH